MQILLKTPDETMGKPSDKPAEWLLEAEKVFYQKRQEKCLLFGSPAGFNHSWGEELPRVERKHHSMNLD